MRVNGNFGTKVAYALLCAGALFWGATQMASADSGSEGSHQGMSPNTGIGKSIDSGHVAGDDSTASDSSMPAENSEPDSSEPHADESNQGMNPNQSGMEMSTDSAAMSEDERESEK